MPPYDESHRWRILHFSWIAFCCTFIAWFAFAPLVPLIQKEFGLSNIQVGWLATAGVAFTIPGRILIGRLVDFIGPRKAYSILLGVMAIPVALLGMARSFEQLIVLRLVIGFVGCGFVIGIRLIGEWFPPRQLGLVEGIYGGWGNAGSAVAALALPLLAVSFGWRTALVFAALPMLVWSIVFWRGVSDVPAGKVFKRTPQESDYSPWSDKRVLILAFAYLATFGSELCLVSFLPKFFADKFGVAPVAAGALAAIFGGFNIIARPCGGWFADRFGRKESLLVLVGGMVCGYLFLGLSSTLPLAICAVILSSFSAQAGDGAIFAIVPLISPTNTGRVAGLVGAAGTVGGVLFPLAFGYGMHGSGGSYLPGFLILSVTGLAAIGAGFFLAVPDVSEEYVHGFEFTSTNKRPFSRVQMNVARRDARS